MALTYKKGDVVEYRPFGKGLRHVRVELKRGNIKNGEPGFQGEIVWDADAAWLSPFELTLGKAWGYDRWITRVDPPDRPLTLDQLLRGALNPQLKSRG